MILTLFSIFFAIAILFLFYGASNDDPMTMTIGFAFLMLPSFALAGWDAPLIPDNPGIQYTTGSNTSTTYTYITNSTNINTETAVEINTYESYTNSMYGTIMLLVASFGMWFSIANIRNTPPEGKIPRIKWKRYR